MCPTCHDVLGKAVKEDAHAPTPAPPTHTCDPDAVASVAAIRRDCKSCPKCGTMIHRIFGCNQMFCTAPGCETAFDWVSLRILDHRRAHNPHLHAFLQARAAAAASGGAAVPAAAPPAQDCDGRLGIPDVNSLTNVLTRHTPRALVRHVHVHYAWIFKMHRYLSHVHYVEAHRYPAAPDAIHPAVNLETRVQYLVGDINEERFKAILQQRERARRRKDAIHQVFRTVVDVSVDLMRRVVRADSAPELDAAVETLRVDSTALFDYANESLKAVSRRYACVVPVFDSETWSTPLDSRKYVVGGSPPRTPSLG